ncbi:hypothetical protein [Polyangium spumosum]|uniref:Uncharacterized protein n=1 Tax=Polyangium spumosum TaxID=889282 RepID=A0A6N7PY64_9BACT|nr:hypothetical protein [Polyangium spumosum]MRG97132.1 hypothetical protein [Polyangium spumosum]
MFKRRPLLQHSVDTLSKEGKADVMVVGLPVEYSDGKIYPMYNIDLARVDPVFINDRIVALEILAPPPWLN